VEENFLYSVIKTVDFVKEVNIMKMRIIIEVDSDRQLNKVAQKAKTAAEEAVIEIVSQIPANTFVNSTVYKVS